MSLPERLRSASIYVTIAFIQSSRMQLYITTQHNTAQYSTAQHSTAQRYIFRTSNTDRAVVEVWNQSF